MNESSPIFILCCERSGSTLLHYILDTHPDICCPGELFVGQLSEILRLTVSRTVPDSLEDREGVIRRKVRGVLEGLLLEHAQAVGKKFWCDKTPSNALKLPEIEWVFPDARYLCLYRDSLDVVQSCLEIPEKSYMWWSLPYVAKHPQNYMAALLENWVEKTENILAFESSHPNALRVRYEDLVADPVKTLGPLFNFLGLGWDTSLVEEVFRVPHDPGGGDYKIQSTHKIEKDRVGKGKLVDPSLLSQVPPALRLRQKALHEQLGYPLVQGGS